MDVVEVPYKALPEETLRAVIENFVLREGTDYDHGIYDLSSKVAQVYEQLKENKAKIVFDPKNETIQIVP